MNAVFISSVITGFEEFRNAAKEAIELMDYKPVMSEIFGARPYSSETACIHEVEQSDVYLLILGPDYGFVTDDGISVTHTEFRAARAANRPILAFVQQCEMESKQLAFKQEVEAYQSGFFRSSFKTADELKDEIIRALRQLETMAQAVSEEEFKGRIDAALKELHGDWHDEPELVLAFLPQPERIIDIVGLEDNLDDIFQKLSKTGIVKLRDGYQSIEEKHWTGIQAGELKLAYFTDGLVLLKVNPTTTNDSLFSGRFAPPDNLRSIAIGFKSLITEKSGYTHIGLNNMNNTYVAPLPEGSSLSMKMTGDNEAGFDRLFTPFTEAAYAEWVDQCIRRFGRIFKYKE